MATVTRRFLRKPLYAQQNGTSELTANNLSGVVSINADGTNNFELQLPLPREASGNYQLLAINTSYQIQSGVISDLTPTLAILTYQTGSTGAIATDVPISNSNYLLTVNQVIVGASTVNTPVYLDYLQEQVYNFNLSFTNSSSTDTAIILVHAVDIEYQEVVNAGPTGPAGPQGEIGPTGSTGPAGSGDTAVNVGTMGIGVFYQKQDAEFQFRNIATDSTLSVTEDDFQNIVLSAVTGSTEGTLTAGNDARLFDTQIREVKLNPGAGEYSSIAVAIASITGASETNPYLVQVGPGVFIEPELNVPSWIDVTGSTILPTIVRPLGNHHIFVLNANTEISFLNLQDAPLGFAAIASLDAGSFTQAHKVTIENSDIGILVTSDTQDSYTYLEYVDVGGTYTTGLQIQSLLGAIVEVNAENFYSIAEAPTTTNHVLVQGLNARANVLAAGIIGFEDNAIGYHVMDGGRLKLLSTYIEVVSIGIQAENGAIVETDGCAIDSAETDIFVPNGGTGSILSLNSISTSGRSEAFLDIENPATTGYFVGVSTQSKINIHPLANFNLFNQEFNVLTVGKRDSQFTSVAAAIAAVNPVITASITSGSTAITSLEQFTVRMSTFAITGVGITGGTTFTFIDESNGTLSVPATATTTSNYTILRATQTNPFLVRVGVGAFVEPSFIVPTAVTLEGSGNTTLVSSNPFANFITLSTASNLIQVTVSSIVGAVGVYIPGNTSIQIRDCIFTNCQTLLRANAGTVAGFNTLVNCAFVGGYTYGMYLDGSVASGASAPMVVAVRTCGFVLPTAGGTSTHCFLTGSFIVANFLSTALEGPASATGNTGFNISDGVQVKLIGSYIINSQNGIVIPNVGAAPNIQISSVVITNSGQLDVNVLHPGTSGVIQAVFAQDKAFIDPASPLAVTYEDPIDPGLVVVGKFNLGPTNAEVTDVQPLINNSSMVGALTGGSISGTGSTLTVDPGAGYLITTNDVLHYTQWSVAGITLPNNITEYIYVDEAGGVNFSPSEPPLVQAIRLGRVRVTPSGVEFIDPQRVNIRHPGNLNLRFIEKAIGPLYVSGSLVSANVNREISVSNGNYFFLNNEFNPTGKGFADSYQAYYHSGGVFVFEQQTIVDNAQYDNGTNRIPLSAGQFTKHSFYIVGDGATERYFLVYGQAQFATQAAAEGAPLPTPPPYFGEGIVPIASIIVGQGNPSVVSILSERPFSGVNSSFVASTVNHGSLLGLLNDDHPQYLLTDGTRIPTGPLLLGGQAITNVSTYNGVVIETHGSRHLPNGADPLTTAAPDVTLSATTTNLVGTANSFARSNHVHAISTGTPVGLDAGAVNLPGTSSGLARADHVHAISTGPAVTLTATSTNATGSGLPLARADHTHAITTGPAVTLDAATTNTTGSGSALARADHTHTITTAVPVNISTNNSIGTSAGLSRADHVHGHGDLPGGTLHLVATGLVPGFMSSADKTKLDAITPANFVLKAGDTMTGNLTLTNAQLRLTDAEGDAVSLAAPSLTSGYTLTLPTSAGSAGQILSTNGSGILSWIALGLGGSMGNTARVDKVLGSDVTGSISGLPFLTVGAAVTAANSLATSTTPVLVLVFPGVYDEVAMTLNGFVTLKGMGEVTIRRLNATVATTLITLNSDANIEGITVQLTSALHVQLRGIVLVNSSTSNISNTNILVDNSTAGAGTSEVVGVLSNGTATPPDDVIAVRDSAITVTSTGSGTKRGIWVSSSNSTHVQNTGIVVSGTSTTSYAVETSNASSVATLNGCALSGVTADVSQTAGAMTLAPNTRLRNNNANGQGFTAMGSSFWQWADVGTLPTGTMFMKIGTNTPDGSEQRIRVSRPMIARSISAHVSSIVAGVVVIFVLRKNGVNTALTTTITAPALDASFAGASVSFAAGDLVSLQVAKASLNNASETAVCVEFF